MPSVLLGRYTGKHLLFLIPTIRDLVIRECLLPRRAARVRPKDYMADS